MVDKVFARELLEFLDILGPEVFDVFDFQSLLKSPSYIIRTTNFIEHGKTPLG